MPSYLARVVTSGARTTPTVRPPLTIVPPVPVLGHPTMTFESPADLDQSPTQLDPDPGETMSPTPPSPAEPAPAIHPIATERSEGIGTLPFPAPGVEAAARSGRGSEVIRAPRGLRPDAMMSTDAPVTPSTPDPVMSLSPAPVSPRPPLPASPRDPLPAADESGRFVRPRMGVEIAAAPRLSEAAPDSPSSHEIARESPMPQEPLPGPSPRAVTTLLPARPPLAGAPVMPRANEREPRITIGRIDVEVHNEPPPAPLPPPPSGPAGRAETSGPGARVASRFLLKP